MVNNWNNVRDILDDVEIEFFGDKIRMQHSKTGATRWLDVSIEVESPKIVFNNKARVGTMLSDLPLTIRCFNALSSCSIYTAEEACIQGRNLSKIPNFGKKSYYELKEQLEIIGYHIP